MKKYFEVIVENVLCFMVSDYDNYVLIYSCLCLVRENVYVVCGMVIIEMWEMLNLIWLEVCEKSFE